MDRTRNLLTAKQAAENLSRPSGESSRIVSLRYGRWHRRSPEIARYCPRMRNIQRGHPGGHAYWFREILFDSPNREEIVYGLVDPLEPGRVRYVGRTLDAFQRYRAHCHAPSSRRVGQWIERLVAEGRYPVMVLLERDAKRSSAKPGDVSEREGAWIRELVKIGQADLNVHTGRPS